VSDTSSPANGRRQRAAPVDESRDAKTGTTADEAPARPPVGARIRNLRQSHGQSLREVADELGIAPSALSMLENEQAGVSLQRLQLIARYFGVAIVDLLSEPPPVTGPEDSIQIIRRAHAVTPSVTRGKGVVYQLPGAKPERLLQPALLSFAPGAGYAEDKIGHVGEEMLYVLLGEVELHYGEEVILLAVGDIAIFRAEVPHAFRNASQTGAASFLAVASPPW
jgi:transcriptional regulator with XRE-family HTH domain